MGLEQGLDDAVALDGRGTRGEPADEAAETDKPDSVAGGEVVLDK